MKTIDDMRYFEARRWLANATRRKMPPFSFSAETRADLERILGPKPELIAALEHQVAPAGVVPGPFMEHYRKRRPVIASQWRKLARALIGVRRALDSLDYDAGVELDTGLDGLWEYEHNRVGPDIDLADFAAHAARIADVLEWATRHRKPQRRGRPVGIAVDRAWLGVGVAVTLQRAGFRLTKGRDGILARTLAVLLDVAKLGAPEDMFDCVRGVVDKVEAIARRREAAAERAAGKLVVSTVLAGIGMRAEKRASIAGPRKAPKALPRTPVQ